jgi:hypothetical protein
MSPLTGRLSARPRLAATLAAAGAAVLLAVLAPTPALAALQYPLIGQLNGSQTAAGSFSNHGPYGAVVDGKTGQALIADSGADLVYVFDTATDSYVKTLNGSGTPAGSFGTGGYYNLFVAANDSTGDIYVADQTHNVIDVLDSSGAFVCQISGAGSAAGDLTHECDSAAPGTPDGAFKQPQAVAVDQATGDIYVADYVSTPPDYVHIDVFSPAGKYLSQLTGGSLPSGDFTGVFSMAVNDHTGQLLIANTFGQGTNGVVDVFDAATGAYVTSWDGYNTPAGSFGNFGGFSLAADNATGDVYVVDPQDGVLDVLDSQGNYLYQITGDPTAFSAPMGLVAVDQATGNQYLGYPGKQVVDIFPSQGVVVPDVSTTTRSATNITQTSATLTGTVNPDGIQVSSCRFEYVSAAGYNPSASDPYSSGQSTSCTPADVGAGTAGVTVSANITGLSESTIYHYRLVATNANGINVTGDQYFVTDGPGFAIKSFGVSATNEDGTVDTHAGSHPYALTTSFGFNTTIDAGGNTVPDGQIKDIGVDLPPGLIGNPTGIPQCSQANLYRQDISQTLCPGASQVGAITITQPGRSAALPVYNLAPPTGMPAQFAFVFQGVPVRIDFSVRTGGDYGVTTSVRGIPQTLQITGQSLTLWGVPSDPSHDAQRVCPGGVSPCSAAAPSTPFLTMPTECNGPLTTTMTADSWQAPGAVKTASSTTQDGNGTTVGLDGCNQLDFSPTITVQPDTTAADSPSGLLVDLHMPQNDNPTGLAEADLKTAVVTLPQGVSVSPSAANGLAACSPDQIGLGNANEPSCPDASKVGSVEVDTPLLPNPLKGGVYVAQQNDNPFGSLLAIYVTADDPVSGVLVKLAGHVVPDPVTGQLQTTFDNNPQLPFSDFKLDFFGGPHGVLATPESCGRFTTSTSMTPWSAPGSGPAATPSDSFTLDSGCVSGFSPSFTAGTTNPQAGRFSPFVLSFSRSDTDKDLSGLSVKLPPGMVAKLAGVGECSEQQLASISSAAGTGAAQAANPSCPASSQVGTVTTGAGAGPDPFFLGGKAYLTGPYKGAPYGLAVVVPAVAGPFDLGTVVVRQALYIDPTTAQVTAVSDPFPTILQGIPLRIRRVDVNLNRPDFTINPTSCNPMAVAGTLTSTGGLSAPVSSRFQVGGCAALGFSPKLKMALTGKGKTRSGTHPTLIATLTQPFGQANIHTAKVTLPLSLALDPNNSQHVCNYDAALAVHGGSVPCPASTIVGWATAVTPLLSKPLSGKVYLVQGIRFSHGNRIHTLPSLLIPLRGQIALDLRAKTSIPVHGAQKLVTTFSTIPDAPVSKFTLTINGGRQGILVITGLGRTICGKSQVTDASFGAQSGKSNSQNVTMSTPCKKIKKAAARHRRRR